MNRQHYQLLTQLLYSVGMPITQAQLASIMDVGERSVRNYITTVNDFLREANMKELTLHANGSISFDGTQKEALAIQEKIFLNDFYEYRLSSYERIQVIVLLLLSTNSYTTASALAEQLYVSKSTLNKDIEEVKYYFLRKQVSFDDAKTKGQRLVLSEITRRNLLLENMDAIINRHFFFPRSTSTVSTGVLYGFAIQLFNGIELRPKLEELIIKFEAEHGIRLNDFEFQSIVHFLIILTDRLRKGFGMQNDPTVQQTADANRLPEDQVYHFGRQILDGALQLVGLLPEEGEYNYLAQILRRKGVGESNAEIINTIDLHLSIKSFIYNISGDLGINLLTDNDLQQFLASHIRSILYRSSSGGLSSAYEEVNHLTPQYEDCQDTVNKNIYVLENALGYHYSRDEIAMIMLHITAAVERFRRKQGAPKAIVVCSCGVATAKYLAEKLLRSFNIDIVSTTSAHRLDDIRTQCEHDLIITTVPLEIEDIPCIWVSPSLNKQDLFRIYDTLLGISGEIVDSENTKSPSDSSASRLYQPPLFRQEHVRIDLQAADWRDAIRKVGQLMVDTRDIEEPYIDAMIECVEKGGPYIVFVPGVAFAHAAPLVPNATFCASIARFDPPVVFGITENDPVHLVVAVQTTDAEEHTSMLFKIMDKICSQPIYEQMVQAPDADALWQIMNSVNIKEARGTDNEKV